MSRPHRPSYFLRDRCGPCSICPNRDDPDRIVGCDGPASARVLLVGEKPAYNEDREGRPFVGRSGEELNLHYLPSAGLSRDNVMLANAVRCFAIQGGDNPTREQAYACASHHLPWVIERMENLELIVTMGGPAYSLLGAEAPRELDIQHGLALTVEDFLGTGPQIVVPTIHPAAGLHKPDEIGRIREDFAAVREVLGGGWTGVEDEHPGAVYEEWDGSPPVEDGQPFLAIDTESDSGAAWCLTFSCAPGTGYLIRADDHETLAKFAVYLWAKVEAGWRVFLHYAAHDEPVLGEMHVEVPPEAVVDTMMLAYHRGLPQALKTLGWRLCGVDMRDYNDVVRPYAERKMFRWVRRAAARLLREDVLKALPYVLLKLLLPPAEYKTRKVQRKHNEAWLARMEAFGCHFGTRDDPMQVEAVQESLWDLVRLLMTTGAWHEKGTVAPWKRVMAILADKARGNDVRPFERWEKIVDKAEEIADRAEELAGPPPSSGISEVPFEEALTYAAADADATRRAGLLMMTETEPRRV